MSRILPLRRSYEKLERMFQDRRLLIFLFFSFLRTLPLNAAEPQGTFIHNNYVSIRALGMGDTISGLEDANVVLYNPAMLPWIPESNLNIGTQASGTPTVLNLYKDLSNASNSTQKEQALSDALANHYGQSYGSRLVPLSLLYANQKWGLAIIPADATTYLEIHRLVGPQVIVDAFNDTTIAFAHATKHGDYFSTGFNVKAIYRAYMGRDFVALDLVNNQNFFRNSDLLEGLTVDGDVGAVYRPPLPHEGVFRFIKYARPTFSVVGRNLLDSGFTDSFKLYDKNTGRNPPRLQRRFDIASRWDLPELWFFKPRFMIEERNIGHRYWSLGRGLHMGFELKGLPWSWLNGSLSFGMSQSYLSAGWTGQLGWLKLELVTFGEEVGTTQSKKQNRNYGLRASVDF